MSSNSANRKGENTKRQNDDNSQGLKPIHLDDSTRRSIIDDGDDSYYGILAGDDSPNQKIGSLIQTSTVNGGLSPLRLEHTTTFLPLPLDVDDISTISFRNFPTDDIVDSLDVSSARFPFQHPEWMNDVVCMIENLYPNIDSSQHRQIAELFMAIFEEYFPEDMIDFEHFQAILCHQFLSGYPLLLPEEGVPKNALEMDVKTTSLLDHRNSTGSRKGKERGKYKCGICKQLKRVRIDDNGNEREHICPDRIIISDEVEMRLVRDAWTQYDENDIVGGRIIYPQNHSTSRQNVAATSAATAALYCVEIDSNSTKGNSRPADPATIGHSFEMPPEQVPGHHQTESAQKQRIGRSSRNQQQIEYNLHRLRQLCNFDPDDESAVGLVHEV